MLEKLVMETQLHSCGNNMLTLL